MSWGSFLSSCEPGCPYSVTEDGRDFGGTPPDSRNRISPGCEPSVCRQSLCLSPVLSLSPQRKQDPCRRPGGPSSISPRLGVPGLGDVASVPSARGCILGAQCTCWAPWRVALESGGELCDFSIHCSLLPFLPQESILPTTALPTASLPDSFIAPPAAAALDPTNGQGCEHPPQPGDPFVQPADLGPSAPPLSVPQPVLPVFTMPLLSPSPAPPPPSPVLPLGPPPTTALNPSTPPAFLQPQKFAEVGKSPSVITHTASATLTHDAAATTFSQSQGLIITTHYPPPSGSPYGLALSPVTRPPTAGPPQPRMTFVHPKPVSLSGGRHKQPPKIVPAPKPEPVSVVLKNACLTPGEPGAREASVTPPPPPLGRFLSPRTF